MSQSLANIWARRIHAGVKTLEDVEDKYGHAGKVAVQEAYLRLYGEEI